MNSINKSSPSPAKQGSLPLKSSVLKTLKVLLDEFNCSHEANLDDSGAKLNHIYNREREHAQIETFLAGNISQEKSGLMYLCGHPGTGKTSSLNFVM